MDVAKIGLELKVNNRATQLSVTAHSHALIFSLLCLLFFLSVAADSSPAVQPSLGLREYLPAYFHRILPLNCITS